MVTVHDWSTRRKTNSNTGKSKKRGTYQSSPRYVPRSLYVRLNDDKSGGGAFTNVDWSRETASYFDPANGTRMHRPGSQNPRK